MDQPSLLGQTAKLLISDSAAAPWIRPHSPDQTSLMDQTDVSGLIQRTVDQIALAGSDQLGGSVRRAWIDPARRGSDRAHWIDLVHRFNPG